MFGNLMAGRAVGFVETGRVVADFRPGNDVLQREEGKPPPQRRDRFVQASSCFPQENRGLSGSRPKASVTHSRRPGPFRKSRYSARSAAPRCALPKRCRGFAVTAQAEANLPAAVFATSAIRVGSTLRAVTQVDLLIAGALSHARSRPRLRLRGQRRQHVVDLDLVASCGKPHLVTAEPFDTPSKHNTSVVFDRVRAEKHAARHHVVDHGADVARGGQCATAPTPGSTGSEMPGG